MYYNKIFHVWIVDSLDYFLISALIGSVIASQLKKYLSEKASMERLKKSIIKKSALKTPIFKSEKGKVKKIYRLFSLEN